MRRKSQILKIINATILMGAGLLIFKWLPMEILGSAILFDASMHIVAASLGLYCIWFFIDQNESWHVPFYVFAALFLFVISVQRIIDNAHNDLGLLLGFIVALLSIAIAERKNLKGKIRF